ncbi:MAG: riboflavin synthase [Sediminibacterium sp.]
MFTGIIEATGIVTALEATGSNISFWVESPISGELKIDQSVSHEGVCLTVDELAPGKHRVTAIAETIQKTNLSNWKPGSLVNLERCMIMNGRLDGHIVQGHVDGIATCMEKKVLDGSWEYKFQIPAELAHLVIEKGSIAINGTSLTCFDVDQNSFRVAIIPYTYNHTSISLVEKGTTVNIEYDVLGKYVERMLGGESPGVRKSGSPRDNS